MSFCFLLLMSFPLTAQENKETDPFKERINQLLDSVWQLKRTKPEKGLELLEQIEAMNNTVAEKHKEDTVWYYYGVLYRYMNQFDLSASYFDKYEAYQENKGDFKRVAAVNLAKANLFSDTGDYDKSSIAVTKALKMYEKMKDSSGTVITLNKLGYLLSEINRHKEAQSYLDRAVKLSKQIARKDQEANAYTNKAIIFQKLEQFDSAWYYYSKAYKIGEVENDYYSRFNNCYNLSAIHQLQGQLDSAVYYGRQAVSIAEDIDVPSISIVAKRLMADLRVEQGDERAAVAIIESISDAELKTLGLRDKVQNYKVWTRAYRETGNYKKAFESLENFKRFNDSLTNLESRNAINELEIAYQTEKKEQQIELLDLENRNAELLISRKNRTILIGALALGFITVLAIVLYVLIRKYFKQKQALAKALGEKNLLLKEIHHRVKNNLQLVSSLLTLQGQSITDDVALKAINEGKNRVRSMALIHQDLYQTENITDVSAETYLLKLCNELFDTYNINTSDIVLQTDIEALNVDVDTLIPLGLILNELITNALKYAFEPQQKGLITIQLKEVDKELQLVVADNGKGYDLNKVNPLSFGNKLVNSLIQQLDGDMTVTNTEGTIILMAFKSYKISRTNS
jgi:two-component sensor histidine kinase/Flp pilus assembly protein TadD